MIHETGSAREGTLAVDLEVRKAGKI